MSKLADLVIYAELENPRTGRVSEITYPSFTDMVTDIERRGLTFQRAHINGVLFETYQEIYKIYWAFFA